MGAPVGTRKTENEMEQLHLQDACRIVIVKPQRSFSFITEKIKWELATGWSR